MRLIACHERAIGLPQAAESRIEWLAMSEPSVRRRQPKAESNGSP
jgi:hypothetical protein